MKKLVSLLLTLVMVLSLTAIIVTAAPEVGSIEISKVAVKLKTGSTTEYEPVSQFSAYRILELESYNAADSKYNYKVAAGWEGFFAQSNVQKYFVTNSNNYIEWKKEEGEDLSARAAEVAKLAIEYAKSHSGLTKVSSVTLKAGSVTTDSNGLSTGTILFNDLLLGYYLVDSTAGALCGLTTTNPNASFEAKNVPPVIKKQVAEDSIHTGSAWGKENSAEIDQVINFDATISVHAGAEGYVLHDQMDSGLSFVGITSVTHEPSSGVQHELEASYYEVSEPGTCGCAFEITFKPDFYDHVKPGDKIVILYRGKLNENAVIGGAGNKNTLWMHYGENSQTNADVTVTRTYGFDLAKTTTDGNLLPGAKFEIYRQYETDSLGNKELKDPVKLVETTSPAGFTYKTYRVATEKDLAENIKTEIEVTDGLIRILGMDGDTYWLKETVAPEDYNILAAPKSFNLDGGDAYLSFDGSGKPVTNSGVQVVNQAGSILPETGAMGTAMFITFGMIVVIGTGVLLVTKKRMSMIQE